MKSLKIFFAFLVAFVASLALAAPAAAGTVPIKATGGTVPIVHTAPSGALCGVPCMRSLDTPGRQKLAAAPANCRYNASACGYESFNYLCDDGCEVIPHSNVCEPVALRNQWSSFWNNSGYTARVYKSTNCTGSYLTYYSSTGEDYFLTSGQTSWENAIGSMRFV